MVAALILILMLAAVVIWLCIWCGMELEYSEQELRRLEDELAEMAGLLEAQTQMRMDAMNAARAMLREAMRSWKND